MWWSVLRSRSCKEPHRFGGVGAITLCGTVPLATSSVFYGYVKGKCHEVMVEIKPSNTRIGLES
jgi:hypothetical protein